MDNEELVLKIQQGEDIKENMTRLYDQNYYLLRKTAKKYSNIDSMTDIDDLMQELYIPLYEATISYKPGNGATFISYALVCISRHLKKYLDDVGRVIRVPIHTQEKIYKYNQVSSYFMRTHNRKPTDRECMAYLELTQKQLDSLKRSMGIMSVSSTEDIVQEDIKIGDTIVDHTADMALVDDRIDHERLTTSLWDAVSEAVSDSDDFQVIEGRYIHGCTLEECGEALGIDKAKARTRENRAIRQLRKSDKVREIAEHEGIIKPYKRNNQVSIDYGSLTDDEIFSLYEAL